MAPELVHWGLHRVLDLHAALGTAGSPLFPQAWEAFPSPELQVYQIKKKYSDISKDSLHTQATNTIPSCPRKHSSPEVLG